MLQREPIPALRPFVSMLWASEPSGLAAGGTVYRERVLPNGNMHLVLRSSTRPLRIFDNPQDRLGSTFDRAMVGGARAGCHLREFVPDGVSVGAELRTGAGMALFSVPAGELAMHHTALDDLWGAAAMLARERIFASTDPGRQLDAFETILAARLPRVHGLHPAVAQALACFRESPSVDAMATASGYSHRHFIALFARETGLTPKRFFRVQRFRALLAHAASHPTLPWTELALAGGYSDQSHFNREFQAFAGMTPGEYRRARPRFPHHVPLATDMKTGQFRASAGSHGTSQ